MTIIHRKDKIIILFQASMKVLEMIIISRSIRPKQLQILAKHTFLISLEILFLSLIAPSRIDV